MSLSTLRFTTKLAFSLINSLFFSDNCFPASSRFFSASFSFDSKSWWAERRFSSSEDAVAREEDAPVQFKQK